MAKFYRVDGIPGARVRVRALGWRRGRFLDIYPIIQWVPYFSQTPILFSLEIDYEERVNSDYREFEIVYIKSGKQERKYAVVHEEENQGARFEREFRQHLEHDAEPLIFFIKFPRTGKQKRLIFSPPIPPNYLFLILVSATIGAIAGAIATKILYN